MPSLGVLGLVLVVQGYSLIRRDVYEEPAPVLDRALMRRIRKTTYWGLLSQCVSPVSLFRRFSRQPVSFSALVFTICTLLLPSDDTSSGTYRPATIFQSIGRKNCERFLNTLSQTPTTLNSSTTVLAFSLFA